MGTPLAVKVLLKAKRIWRELDPAERQFASVWPSIDAIGGWLLPDEAKWLFKAARKLPDGSNIVEIGSYKGRSTCCLALGCRGTKRKVFALDTFDGGPDLERHDSFQEFHDNVSKLNLLGSIEPIRGISWDIAKTWSKPIHFLFIDGSHIYEHVMADFAAFFPHVVPGGTIAFHDVHESHPGVLKAWQEAFQPSLVKAGRCESLAYGEKPG